MSIFLFPLVFILSFGLISCSSDSTKSDKTKIIFHEDNFDVSPPQIIQLENQNIVSWKNLHTHSSPLKIFDSIEIDTKLVSEINVDSQCSQNNIQYDQKFQLETKSQIVLFELLPFELIKKFENSIVTCNFTFLFLNQHNSTHTYEAKSVLINPTNWPHNFNLSHLKTGALIENHSDKSIPVFHATSLSLLDLRSLSDSAHLNALTLACEHLEDTRIQHPYPELSKIDWKKWIHGLRLIKNKLKISCRILTHKNQSVSGWTIPFHVYTDDKPVAIKNLQVFTIGDKPQKPIEVRIKISNPTSHQLYMRVNKSNLTKSIFITDGFHLFKSNLISANLYTAKRIKKPKFMSPAKNTIYISPHFYWVTSNQIHFPEINSSGKNIGLYKEDSKNWYFRINKKSDGELKITFNRHKRCRNIFVEHSEVNLAMPLKLEFVSDLSAASLQNPLDKMELTNSKNIVLQNQLTPNKKLEVMFQARYPELMNPQKKMNYTSIIQNMKKNYISNFDCSAESLPNY